MKRIFNADMKRKNIIFSLMLILLTFAASGFAQSNEVSFDRYESYFVKNNTGEKSGMYYYAVTDKEQFDKIFGAARTMGQQTFLPADAFESQIVVTAIKRGGSLRRYSDVSVTAAEDGKLIVSYTAKDDKPGSATFNSPLVIAVGSGDYSEVVFMENGKKVGTAKINN